MVRGTCPLNSCINETKRFNRVVQNLLFPFKEDLCRFDFEVDPEDEYMCFPGMIPEKTE